MLDILIFAAAGFFVWWWGYFTGACMRLAKRADDEAQDIYEHWRGER